MKRLGTFMAAAALALSVGTARGGDEKPAAPAKAEKPPAEQVSIFVKAVHAPHPGVKVWTNDDLALLSRGEAWATEGSAPTGEAEEGSPSMLVPADPLTWLEDEQKQAQSRQTRVAAAQTEVDTARQNVEALQVQLRAVANPFAARPKLSEEEEELRRTSGETAAERYQRTQKALEEAQARLAAAQSKLDRAKSGGK